MKIWNEKNYATLEEAQKHIFTGIAVIIGSPKYQHDNGGFQDGPQSFGSWVRVEEFCISGPDCYGHFAQGIARATIENMGTISDRERAEKTAEKLAEKYNAPIYYQ